MISKHSFHKIMKFDLRQRSWLMLLLFVLHMLILPVMYLISLQNAVYNAGDLIENGVRISREQVVLRQKIAVTESFFSQQNVAVTMILILAAVLCAATGYAWLCSGRKVDFYHSIAVRREKIFRALFAGGIVIAIVPYIICAAVGYFGIGSVSGAVSHETLRHMLTALGSNVLVFAATYAVCVLAMVLSGRVVIGCLLSIMFLVYGPLAQVLYEMLMPMAYSTWFEAGRISLGLYASPLSLAALIAGFPGGGRAEDFVTYIVLAAIAAGAAAAAFLVYRKRPSETAGNAYVHPILQAVFKVAVAVPSAMVFGSLFQMMAYSRPRFWFAGGAVIGAVIACAVMEAVQSVDLKNIYRHWKSALAALALTCGVIALLLMDPLGYETYLPEKDDLAAIGFVSTEYSLAEQVSYMDNFYMNGDAAGMLEGTLTEDLDTVYPLAEKAVETVRENRKDLFEAGNDAAYAVQEAAEENTGDLKMTQIQMVYRLKNGAERYRQYTVPAEMARQVNDKLTENMEYRKRMYPINRTTADMFNRIDVSSWILSGDEINEDPQTIRLTGKERNALLEAMRTDVNGCSMEMLRDTEPAGLLTFIEENETDGSYMVTERAPAVYYIYPMYEQTIAFLEGKGYTLQSGRKLEDAAQNAVSATIYYHEREWRLTSKEEISEVMQYLEKTRYWNGTNFTSITLEYSDGTNYNIDCIVKNDAALDALLKGKEVY